MHIAWLFSFAFFFFFLRQTQAYKYPIVHACSHFPSTLYPLRVDHMLRAAHSAPVVDLPHRLAMFQWTCWAVKHAAGE